MLGHLLDYKVVRLSTFLSFSKKGEMGGHSYVL